MKPKGELRNIILKEVCNKQKRSPRFEFKDGSDYRLLILARARADVEIAKACIDKAQKLKRKIPELDDMIMSALWQKAIMAYGRCFNSPVQLKDSKCFKEERSRIFHRQLISLRSEYIGHQGQHDKEVMTAIVTLRASKGGYSFVWHFPGAKSIGHYLDPARTKAHFKQLIGAINAEIDAEIRILETKLQWDPEIVRSIIRREQAKRNPAFDQFRIPAKFQ